MKKYLLLLLIPWVGMAQPGQGGGPFPGSVNQMSNTLKGSFIEKLNGFGTNTTFPLGVSDVAHGSENLGQVYIGTNPPFAAAGYSWIDFLIPNTNGMFWSFSKTPFDNAYGTMFFNPVHDVGGPASSTTEWQWSSPHYIALGMASGNGAGHLQFGIGLIDQAHTNGGNYLYMQNMGTGFVTNGHSGALVFRTAGLNGAGAVLFDKYPGFVSQVTATNGPDMTYELDLFPDLNNSGGVSTGVDDGKWNVTTLNTNGMRFVWTQKVLQALLSGDLGVKGAAYMTNGMISYANSYSILGAANDLGSYDFFLASHAIVIGNAVSTDFTIKNAGGSLLHQVGDGVLHTNAFNVYPLVSSAGWAGAPTTTNRVAISATGYTNTLQINSQGVDVDVYFKAATAAVQDNFGTVLHTYTALTTEDTYCHMKPNWRLVGTSMVGDAIAH